MLSTAPIPRLPVPNKTGELFHESRRLGSYSKPLTIRSSSSVQEIKKPPVSSGSSDERRELLSSWESISLPPVQAAKRVVLVRHGQSTWNAEGRIQGSSDFSVLTIKGESQAETSRQMLLDDSFDVCFSSPLIRSKRTAEIIWGSRKEEIITEFDLREIDLYSFQGLLKNEGKARYGAAYRQWQIDAPNFNIDDHYPVRELWARARSCWTEILTHKSRSILVVAHNAVNQALVATAIGLGTEYFRVLLQSNCGVSVLDFTPKPEGGSPSICLNRLNQTPSSPIASGSSGGRKTSMRVILVCHGLPLSEAEEGSSFSGNGPMNMLGMIQAQKTAELLLDIRVSSIVCSSSIASVETANSICRVQEAADCLGADCVPRYVEMKQIFDLDIGSILEQTKKTDFMSAMQFGFQTNFSVGGLGQDKSLACVSNILVENITMLNTLYGARIKTWQGGLGSVKNVSFWNIQVTDVKYPIVIDQYYCDKNQYACKNQTEAVAISGVEFNQITGTYASQPIHMACSISFPCIDVVLDSIQLQPPKKNGALIQQPLCARIHMENHRDCLFLKAWIIVLEV